MKNVIIGTLTVGMLSMITACGGGHGNCDAYNKANYTKYKSENSKKIELNIRKK